MNDRTAVYIGVCPACQGTPRVELSWDPEDKIMPPPVIVGIHQCQLPVVQFELVYRG